MMKTKLFVIFFVCISLISLFQDKAIAWGPVTHMTTLNDILKDPRLNADVKKILQDNMKYAKGGATGPDMHYFHNKRFADMAHYCSPGDLAKKMLAIAKTSQEKAFAYGWMVHVASDSIGHAWVNSVAGGEYNPKNPEIVSAHRDIEMSIDKKNFLEHAVIKEYFDPETGESVPYPYYDTDIDAPNEFLQKVFKENYGCSQNAPSPLTGELAENVAQAAYNLEPSIIFTKDAEKYNTAEYREEYQRSIDEAIRTLNSSGATLKNWDLDTGQAPFKDDGITPNDKYGGYIKCNEYGKLVSCGPITTTSPGGDHPDDTVAIDSGNSTSEEVSLNSFYRLAVKKNKTWILWQKALEDANAEYEALPADASPELSEEKLNKISALINMLNDPFNYREFTVNNPQLSSETFEVPDVAVLENGYFEDMTGLINKKQEPVRTVSTNFSPEIVKNHAVLVIPSGGLYGLENSAMLKAQFNEYVKQGGTLIVFAQQRGYEFSVLPVPQEADGTFKTITGYGWTEDQSCLWNGTYIDTYHQILSAITTSTVSANVDGYFTNYPSNSNILLRRTANGQPAMLMYEYGLGKVIVSSMFSDWGYAHSQATQDEIKLVRDMIAWAKKPATLPEIKPGQTASVQVEVRNNTTVDAASVRFLIYNPDRTTASSSQLSVISIQAGQTVSIPVSYTSTLTSALGIYHIDYELLDAQGNIIQPQAETDSGRFVVSKPPSNPYKSTDFNFALNSDLEHYAYGSDATFTVTVWNNTDADRSITTRACTFHLTVAGAVSCRSDMGNATPKTLNVPARSSASFQLVATNVTWEGWLVAIANDEAGKQVGYAQKGIWMFRLSISISATTDKTLYAKGETVTINAALKNNTIQSGNHEVKITITDPKNIKVFEDTKTASLSSYGTGTSDFSFVLPATLSIGTYTVKTEAYYGTRLIASSSTSFELSQSQITVTLNLPSVFTAGSNTIPFVLNNTGKIGVSSGSINIIFKDPDGIVVYSGSQPFALTVGENKTLNVPISISPLKFGNYTLTFTQSDETRTGNPTTIFISNASTIGLLLDKSSYRIRETANFTVNIANTGKFNLNNATVAVSAPDVGYTDTKTINIGQGQSQPLQYAIPIPETTTAGQHDVNVTLSLPSGSSITQSSKFTIPDSSLAIEYTGPTSITTGDTITLTIENTGGVDTTYSTEKLTITDSKGVAIYQGNPIGTILAGEKKTLTNIQILQQTVNGFVFLNVQIKDTKAEKLSYLYKIFEITGITATLDTKTDKSAYLKTEAITGLSKILNGQVGIEDGTLNIAVSQPKPQGTGEFKHFLPLKGWASFQSPPGVAVASDGSVYVLDTYNYQNNWPNINKFDSNGNFIAKWRVGYSPGGIAVAPDGSVYVTDIGSINKFDSNGKFMLSWGGNVCTTDSNGDGIPDQPCDGQFNYPKGVAVASDSSVYVVDSGNNRIQKFDSNGNFITKWGSGSYCRTDSNWDGIPDQPCDGQFNSPKGVAVDAAGFVYVADSGNNRIQKFDSNGNFITKWGSGSYCRTDTNGDGIPDQPCDGQFNYPAGIAVGHNGSFHVVDAWNNRIQKFDNNGNFISKLGNQGSGNGQFNSPLGIALSQEGSIYVADTGNNRIQKFDGNYSFLTKWGNRGSGDGEFRYPKGIATGNDGSVYVADTSNHRIQKFNKNGNFITKWGSYGTLNGQFNGVQGIAIDSNDFIYVIDDNRIFDGSNSRIQKFDNNGNFISILENYSCGSWVCRMPVAIAVGPDDYVYVAYSYYSGSYHFNAIKKYDKNGNYVKEWGSLGSGNGQFNYIADMAVSSDGYVYVVDSGNYRIQKFDNNGNFIAKWGSWGYGNGYFRGPEGIAVDIDGFVYISDYRKSNIQKFDDNGQFITKWDGTEDTNFNVPSGMATAVDGTIYVADYSDHRILRMSSAGGGIETLFETTVPITQSANTTQDYTTTIGILNATGKLYLNAELKNSLGQTIATAEYPFYIIEGNTLLLYSTDKKFYRPGEPVNITGEVRNLASITASALNLQLSANSQNIYTTTFDVPAGGTHPFTFTTTASAEGTYTLAGKVIQNNSTLVEIADLYEVANPKASVSVTASDVVGNKPFNINVEIKNEGKVNISIQYIVDGKQGDAENAIDNQQITIPAGETKTIQYSQQITGDTTYTFTFTGDLSQTITKTVAYGLSASVSVSASEVYSEGKIAIPVTITNTGLLDTAIDARYRMQDSSGNLINEQIKTYYIPKGGSATDTLYYNLTEGSYQLSAISAQPEATANASFVVKKTNNITLSSSIGLQSEGLIPMTVNLTNSGYNDISGSLQLALISTQGAAVWNGAQDVDLPANYQSPAPGLFDFNINPSAIQPGDYTLKAELLNNSNLQLASGSQTLTIKGPAFKITQLPQYQTFYPAEEASFTFKVKNTGSQEGAAELNFRAYDLIDSTQREWLKPDEEKTITFSFILPDDLEEKDYFADYELKAVSGQQSAVKGQVKYHLAGINLNVNATLDKQNYSEGETARLTIAVSSQQSVLSLFARVNYAGYENQQSFTLGQGQAQPLQFDIPLTQITGEKLFYGIYHESGRSIHLNSLYIYKAGEAITITTDKQVYNPGDLVAVAISSQQSALSGTMTLSVPNYTETFNFTGTATKSFALPSLMTAGTYQISYQLSAVSGETYTASHPFDVNGIQVKVKEATLDKAKYAASDTLKLGLNIESNKNMPATLKTWIIDPEGKYTSIGESAINLLSSEPLLFTDNYSLFTSLSGIHRLVYGIYSGELLLVSGSEAFDVGDAVLLGLSTDKTDYPTNSETVTVSVSLSAFGTVDANLELQLDGTTVKNESVALNGFTTLNLELGTVKPGTHTLKGIITAGGLKSTKEINFVYGSSLPDLTVAASGQPSAISKDNTIQITATVMNQGKTPSSATTISLYDVDSLIEAKTINTLNPSELQEMTFIWNVLGKAGEHIIRAVADPDNTVTEFNEDNNTAQTNVLVPDILLITETDKDTYKMRQKADITSTITNLTSAKTYNNLVMLTSIKDASGNEVFQSSRIINIIQPSGNIMHTDTWNTSGISVDGTYTITQTLASGSLLMAQSSKLIALQKAPDFTLRTDTDYRKIKQGEKATYTAYIEPINGWISEIALNMEGLPSGTSVSFDPGNFIPPGQLLTLIITTDATTTGIHNLNLTAQGIDEGETVIHTLPLMLDVSGFGLTAEQSGKTVKQLETATFEINVNSLNGYEGEVNLSISGVPNGVKASFDKTKLQVLGNVKLTVITSKYVRPDAYTLIITGDDSLVKHKLKISLNLDPNPEISAGIITAQGPGPNNQAAIKIFNSSLQPVLDLTAFNTKYGAYAVGADIDGDGYDEIIVSQGPDPKNSATLKAFRRNGTPIAEYTAFDTKYGLTLSSGDIDGDWKDEIIVGMGPDPKNPSTLKILKYNGAGFTELMTQTVFDTKYGLNTAVGDIDGDGMPEIITAAGPGTENSAIVKIWEKDGRNLSELYSFEAFDGSYGVNIAAGDIDGDGKAEIITGTGPDPKNSAIVRIFKAGGTLIGEIRPYDTKHDYGVFVSAEDIDGDGIDEIITGLGPGPQNPSWVKVFRYDGSEIYSFISYPDSVKYGVRVSKGNIGH